MGWHHSTGIYFDYEYGLAKSDVKEMVRTSDALKAFADLFFEKVLDRNRKSVWIEKTPANCYNFDRFLNDYPEGKIILTTRNPLDAIASLSSRGLSMFDAVVIYLLNNARALTFTESGLYILKYEDLVLDPTTTVQKLCAFIGVEFEPPMLKKSGYEGGVTKMKGWNYDETGIIASGSIHRFGRLQRKERVKMKTYINSIRIKDKLVTNKDFSHKTLREIAEVLDYDISVMDSLENMDAPMLRPLVFRKKWTKLFNGHYYNAFNFPIEI